LIEKTPILIKMANGKRTRDTSVSEEELESSDEDMSEESATPASTNAGQLNKRLHMDASHTSPSNAVFFVRCSLPPHVDMDFLSHEAYDVHYEQVHLNRCLECGKNFPSDHYLQLHIAEHHDPITAVKKERGERTVSCEGKKSF